jgi:hypothetical protein
MSLQQIRENILKGCGDGWSSMANIDCNCVKGLLCPVCQAKLSTLDLIEKDVQKEIAENQTMAARFWRRESIRLNKEVEYLKSKLSLHTGISPEGQKAVKG